MDIPTPFPVNYDWSPIQFVLNETEISFSKQRHKKSNSATKLIRLQSFFRI